ncbi:polysaccharide biosynthesis protein HsfF [soil metagenome]
MFWRGVLGYLPVNIVQGVVGVLTLVIFTRVLSPDQYGAYALAFSAMSLAHTAVFTWLQAAMARFFAAEEVKGELPDHFTTLYRLWFVLAALFALVGAAALAFWPMPVALKLALGAGLACALVQSVLKMAQEHRRAAGKVSAAAMIDIVQIAGGFAVGAALALLGMGGGAPLAGAAGAAAVCLTWALPSEVRQLKGGRFRMDLVRRYAAYGYPVALSLILALVLSTTDRVLLSIYADQATVGVYHAGYSLANRTLDVMFVWFGMAAGPAAIRAFERGGRAALDVAAREQASFMVLLTLPAAVGVSLVASPLVEVMVGENLRQGAALATRWVVLSGFFSGVTTYYFHTAFTLGKRTTLMFVAMAIPAGLNVVLNFLLVPRFGLQGALWATAISYGVGMLASIGLGRRAMPLPIPWNTLGRAGIAAAAMATAVLLVPAFGGVLELAVKAAVGGLVYGIVVMALDAGHARTLAVQLLQTRRLRLVSGADKINT